MLAIILLALLAASSAEDRIYNGKEAEPDLNNVIFIVSRYEDPSKDTTCTGTVISEHYILTAAHCLEPPPKNLQIYTRDLYHHDKSKLPTPAFESNIGITHPEYYEFLNDIGLIKVSKPMGIPPVPLAANYFHPKNDWLRVAGYGNTKYQVFSADNMTSSDRSKMLMETYLKARSKDDCLNASVIIEFPDWHVICMYKHDSTILQGDSGGPAFAQGKDGRFYQVGVNVNVATSKFLSSLFAWKMPSQSSFTAASLSTDVSYYCPWIEESTGREVKCQTFKPTKIVPKF